MAEEKRLCDYGCGKEAKYYIKYNDTWCCGKNSLSCICNSQYNQDSIEMLHDKSKQFGGECLSTEYINMGTKYKWKCADGHVFWKSWGEVKIQERWCPHCYLNIKEEMSRFIFEQLTGYKFIRIKEKISNYRKTESPWL